MEKIICHAIGIFSSITLLRKNLSKSYELPSMQKRLNSCFLHILKLAHYKFTTHILNGNIING